MSESNAADGHILWHNCAPGVYLHGRKVICKHNLTHFLYNIFSVSVTFVSDASHSASGMKLYFSLQKYALKDSGLPTNWLPAQEPTTSPMVVFLVLPGPIDYQGTKTTYQHILCNKCEHMNYNSLIRNLTCTFTVTAPTGSFISVYFRYMAISPSPNCSSSHLEVKSWRMLHQKDPPRFMTVPVKPPRY